MNARMDEEVSYVDQLYRLFQWLNEHDSTHPMTAFSEQWYAVRDAGKLQKIRACFAPEKADQEHGAGRCSSIKHASNNYLLLNLLETAL
jgi:hypothetical protein